MNEEGHLRQVVEFNPSLYKVLLVVAPDTYHDTGSDDGLRRQAEYMKLWTDTTPLGYPSALNKIDLIVKEVFEPNDVIELLEAVQTLNRERLKGPGWDPAISTIHFICHGTPRGISFANGSTLELTQKKNREPFEGLLLDCILFSSCQLGRQRDMIERLAHESETSIVLAYNDVLLNSEAYLIDTLIYHMLLGQSLGSRDPVEAWDLGDRLNQIINLANIYHSNRKSDGDKITWFTPPPFPR